MDAKFERPPGIDNDARAQVALHEASHSVAMLKLRLGVREVMLNQDCSGSATPVGNPIGLKGLIACAAGHAADRRCCPDMIRSSPPDAAKIALQADLLSASRRGRLLLAKWAQAEAEHLVKTEWGLIVAVASKLLKHGRLSGRQVSRIVRRYDANKRTEIEGYLKAYPNWQEILKARKQRLLRGRKPLRSDVARAMAEAATNMRFISERLYQATADRLCAKGFAEREVVEALDECDVFPEYEIAKSLSVGERRPRLSESGPPVLAIPRTMRVKGHNRRTNSGR